MAIFDVTTGEMIGMILGILLLLFIIYKSRKSLMKKGSENKFGVITVTTILGALGIKTLLIPALMNSMLISFFGFIAFFLIGMFMVSVLVWIVLFSKNAVMKK